MSDEHAYRLHHIRHLAELIVDIIARIEQSNENVRFLSVTLRLHEAALHAFALGCISPNPFAHVVCSRPEPGALREETGPAPVCRNYDRMMTLNPLIKEVHKLELRDPLSPDWAECYLWCTEESAEPTGPQEVCRELGDWPRDRENALRILKAWELFVKKELKELDDGSPKESVIAAENKPDDGVVVVVTPTPAETATAKPLLTGWHAIAAALGMKHDDAAKIKGLNKGYNGPIKSGGKGKMPMVNKDDLLQWWNHLAVKQHELSNLRDGAELSGEAQQYSFRAQRHGRP